MVDFILESFPVKGELPANAESPIIEERKPQQTDIFTRYAAEWACWKWWRGGRRVEWMHTHQQCLTRRYQLSYIRLRRHSVVGVRTYSLRNIVCNLFK